MANFNIQVQAEQSNNLIVAKSQTNGPCGSTFEYDIFGENDDEIELKFNVLQNLYTNYNITINPDGNGFKVIKDSFSFKPNGIRRLKLTMRNTSFEEPLEIEIIATNKSSKKEIKNTAFKISNGNPC